MFVRGENKIKTKNATKQKDNKDFQRNPFNDFYNAYNTTPQKQSNTNHSQTRTKDNIKNAELKNSSPEQEINSMIEWSQV